jgi:hypothetical protein
MTTFAVQYLESPYADATSTSVRRCLRQACERLPISFVLLGWEVSPSLEEAVAEETTLQHAQLYRWQPLLAGSTQTNLPTEWASIGPAGNPILGPGGKPEFSFICPNHAAVTDFLSERVEIMAARGLFQGLFLDRIRFTSPSLDPLRDLACFCPHCTQLAAETGLDLEFVRRYIFSVSPEVIARSLLGQPTEAGLPLESFLDFRSASITRTVLAVAKLAHSLNLSIGLDCFTPALTRLVGQDLSALDGSADWVKIMTYPRVNAPAGISYELLSLSEWLIRSGLDEGDTMHLMSEACGLTLPVHKNKLSRSGLGSEAVTHEINRGYELGVTNLLAGIALVRMGKIHESTLEQIQSDLKASLGADGLVISWDLWLTPLEYIDCIRTIWS